VPSMPKFRALVAKIESMEGGWESIFEAIADGATYRMLGEKYGVSRAFMHRVVVHDPERRKRAEEAYKLRADALVDESLDIADNVNVNLPASVQKAKLQIELRQWLAAVDNARYKKQEAARVNVNVSIGQLHLDALRRRRIDSRPALDPDRAITDGTPDVEIVESEHE
jgi:terminase small subunit-like protein